MRHLRLFSLFGGLTIFHVMTIHHPAWFDLTALPLSLTQSCIPEKGSEMRMPFILSLPREEPKQAVMMGMGGKARPCFDAQNEHKP